MIPVRGRIVDFLIDRCSDGYAEFLFKSDYDKDCPRFEALCAGKIPDVVPGVPITTEFAADNMDKILKIDFRELKIEKITKYVKEKIDTVYLTTYKVNGYLGIDAGSTTIKVVLISENSEILYSHYSHNKGNPLENIITTLKELYSKLSK